MYIWYVVFNGFSFCEIITRPSLYHFKPSDCDWMVPGTVDPRDD